MILLKRFCHLRPLAPLLFLASLLAGPSASAQTNGVLREVYRNISGNAVADLTNSLNYPNNPDIVEVVTNFFEGPINADDAYGQRMRAYLLPKLTGAYTFFIASDDNSTLFLSTDESPANKAVIASLADWSNSREYLKYPSQKSAPVSLDAGKRYYIEALMKEGGGGDNLAVAWQKPGDPVVTNNSPPIPASFLVPFGQGPPVIQTQPSDLTVVEGGTATFTLQLTRAFGSTFQWLHSGTNLPGATAATLNYGPVVLADSGTRFVCIATNSSGSVTSNPVALQIAPDVIAPTIVRAFNSGTQSVQIAFSEPMDPVTLLTASNYTLDMGASVISAVPGVDTLTVILNTAGLVYGNTYTLTVNNVRDRAGSPNVIAPNTKRSITILPYSPAGIGNPAIAGGINANGNGFDVTGSGADIGGTADQFQFSYQQKTGNFDIRVRVDNMDASSPWMKAGLIARANLNVGSSFAAALTAPGLVGSFFQSRSADNSAAATVGNFPGNGAATWLRLSRAGNVFTGYGSYDGQGWVSLGSITISMPSTIYFGMAVVSHDINLTGVAQFRDLSAVTNASTVTVANPNEPLGPSTRRTSLVISEIMYKPGDWAGTNNLEFIEIYNANPFLEEMGGVRIAGGAISYTFPPGTILRGGAFVVLAASPDDVRRVYGITNVLGPYMGSLKKQDTVRVLSPVGAVLLEVSYSNNPPWPVAADGTGHSMVLQRPSYGEGDPRAWDISDAVGGSPGKMDAFRPMPQRSVVINEFLAHTDPPLLDYIELYNHSRQAVDISGCVLTDHPVTNLFVIPAGTIIPAGGFVAFDENQLGFRLSALGETLYFKNADRSRVLDAVSFEGQENSVSMGRSPDGGPEFYPMKVRTQGKANSEPLIRDVVINELMYKSITGDKDDQFIELYNQGTAQVNIGGWRFTSGVAFTFPTNTLLAPGAYLVIARNRTNLFSKYSNLTPQNTLGDFGGSLSGNGDRVALSMSDQVVNTNTPGVTKTNTAWIVVDEVSYRPGGRWGKWSDGGGSSLELVDARANHRLGDNWADSDETQKSQWTTIENTGVLDNGANYESGILHFQIGLMDIGECLVDDVTVVPVGGSNNYVTNGGFEQGLAGWSIQGNHTRSSLENAGFSGAQSLHVRTTGRMWTGANSVQGTLSNTTLAANQTATMRFKAKWLHGIPWALMRLNGNWLEAAGQLQTPINLGTPGARNSRAVANNGPAISAITHSPPVPAASQPVVVSARVEDPDGLASIQLKYRVDPATTYGTLNMVDNGLTGDDIAGDGVFSATIPGVAAAGVVAFYVQATDKNGAITRFPRDPQDTAPVPECVVYFGDTTPFSSFGTYRLWVTQTYLNRWSNFPDLSNEFNDATFVNGNRIIYNVGARYAGSPYHQQFDTPIGSPAHYRFDTPADEPFLGTTSINKIHAPGNGPFDDATLQREQTFYWLARQMGLPWNYRRYVAMFINGRRRGTLMEDTQVPNGEMVQEYFSNDNNGDLYKIQPWFEFGANGSSFNNMSWAMLNVYNTTAGVKKTARYRWNFLARKNEVGPNNYTNVFQLADVANRAANTPAFVSGMSDLADMEEWMRIFACSHSVGDWDHFGTQNAQNMYGYKPQFGKWTLFLWDCNILFGNGSWAAGQNLTSITGGDRGMANIYGTPAFTRALWRGFKEIAGTHMDPARINTVVDEKSAVFKADGINVTDGSPIKTYASAARASILSQVASQNGNAPFALGTLDRFTSANSIVTLSGTAPVEMKYITVNGLAYPVTWNDLTRWSITVAVNSPTNVFVVGGLDVRGNTVTNAPKTVTVVYTGTSESPVGKIMVNEIMYNPLTPGASFIEIYNASTVNAFDLSGWRLEGADYVFPPGTILGLNSYLVLGGDVTAFTNTYGSSVPLFGVFNGKLSNNGETLRLIKPGATPDKDLVVHQVRYESTAPWPADANGFGPSLQLVDATKDPSRVANWRAVSTNDFSTAQYTPGAKNSVATLLPAIPNLWLNEVMPDNQSGIQDRFFHRHPWVEIYNRGTTTVSLDGLFLTDTYSDLTQWAFPAGSTLAPGVFKVVYLSGSPETGGAEWHTSFKAAPVTGSVILTKLNSSGQPYVVDYLNYQGVAADRSYGALPDGTAGRRLKFFGATPGATNNFNYPALPLFINEWMAKNDSILKNPADGRFDDWFELHNAGPNDVDIGGFTLSDVATNKTKFTIPQGYTIPGNGFLLVWADSNSSKNSTNDPALHTSFKLSASGSFIGLYAPDGTTLDQVSFGAQVSDVSQGRFPDASSGSFVSMTVPTPAAPNVAVRSNSPPVLGLLPDRSVDENALLTFTVSASDPDTADRLTFGFNSTPPEGANLNSASGVFTWTPTEAQGPGVYTIAVRVTDNGQPAASVAGTFKITVREVNTAPALDPIADVTVTIPESLAFAIIARDTDLPFQPLNFKLGTGAPAGAAIDSSSGFFTWTPSAAQAPSTNNIIVTVTDNGIPVMGDSRSFKVIVLPPSGVAFTGISIAPNGQVTLEWIAANGQIGAVDAKDDLNATTWTTLGQAVGSGGSARFTDTTASGHLARFYRVRLTN